MPAITAPVAAFTLFPRLHGSDALDFYSAGLRQTVDDHQGNGDCNNDQLAPAPQPRT
jgi:hypothetical protein